MKNSIKYLYLIFAAIAAGGALFSLINASFTALLRGDLILAIVSSLALLGFAAYDFSGRRTKLPVVARDARVRRPTLPASNAAHRSDRLVRSYRNDQIAA